MHLLAPNELYKWWCTRTGPATAHYVGPHTWWSSVDSLGCRNSNSRIENDKETCCTFWDRCANENIHSVTRMKARQALSGSSGKLLLDAISHDADANYDPDHDPDAEARSSRIAPAPWSSNCPRQIAFHSLTISSPHPPHHIVCIIAITRSRRSR